ncbi:hypothetical protein [Mycobacterium pseudokansasii]|uniref:Uncharacterized protein n=1 Tax=Mycobacterium pseudokansasii TaxID=2341080 RepID=A0A498QR77_9MYCO|nr:hypothetical protein [Mycobacterium pseudokansasii]VAZ93724.1 hypothetical protein LAUMK35_02399 [Mycobacterium pseudokansasii]VAZ94703.1 hypothetical protein LAUMK21_02400 [Mycobacterium pseudokansasii]VBA49971.1 hypothetical protein LAUMK142_02290 [Mycobacterium pseudokansasii]
MGMTEALSRYALRRVHVLTVEVPGEWVLRAAVEQGLAHRGWCAAVSPADADVLAVCGVPGAQLADVVDLIWDQLPGPRARIDVGDMHEVDAALRRAAAALLDCGRQREDARNRAASPTKPNKVADQHEADHGAMHHDMDHGGMHDHMGHGDMDMAPAGIALAEGGEDRDGLEMDVLHLRLGPVLAHWPAGLVLRCSLQGDVIVDAEPWWVDSEHRHGCAVNPVQDRECAARQCDHIEDLLALAGWSRAAGTARQTRDLLLGGSDAGQAQAQLDKLDRVVRRSRLLRWSLRNLGPLTAEDLNRRQLPVALSGDTYDRLLTRIGQTRELLSEPLSANIFRSDLTRISDMLPHLVRGLDIASARLVIASLGIDSGASGESGAHG